MSMFALAEIMSALFMFPIPAFTTEMFFSFNRTKRASKLPKESAFTIIPCFSVFILSESSFLNFSLSNTLSG